MKLSPRLKAIADLVEEKTLIDIGCDHALLDIYCTLEKGISCIASDVNAACLEKAKKNLKRYHLENQIPLYLSNGVKEVPYQNPCTVVIAGMGSHTMVKIIKDMPILPSQLILQSNKDLAFLRKQVTSYGYVIKEERLVKDGNIWNVICSFRRGKSHYHKWDYELGPILRTKKDHLTKEYYQFLYRTNGQILKQIPKWQTRFLLFQIRKKKLEQVLHKFQ